MIDRLASRMKHPADKGFTLIELLVVIVILGILAAVVVFAVQGVGDKGRSASTKIDERTIRTAEEAFCAKFGRYADGPELQQQGFLSDLPTIHLVAAGPGGGCQAAGDAARSGYAVSCPLSSISCPAPAAPSNVFVSDTQSLTYVRPTLAKDPSGSSLATGYGEQNSKTCYVGISTDNGGTWTTKALAGDGGLFPFPAPYAGDANRRCWYSVVAYSPTGGILYYVFNLSIGFGAPSETYFTKSGDGGANFTPLLRIGAAGGASDVESQSGIAVDRTTGRIYESWYSSGKVMLTTSTNQGTSFAAPVQVNPASQQFVSGRPFPAIAPDGKVYVLYFSYDQENGFTAPGVWIARSDNNGATFNAPVKVTTTGFNTDNNGLGVGPGGEVYVSWFDDRVLPGGAQLRTFFSKSSDQGGTWSPPLGFETPTDTGRGQFHSSLSTAPNGRIDLFFYSTQNTANTNNPQDVYLTSSTDGGITFTTPRPLDSAPSTHTRGRDSHVLVSTNVATYAVWVDSRRETPTTFFKTDVAFAAVPQRP